MVNQSASYFTGRDKKPIKKPGVIKIGPDIKDKVTEFIGRTNISEQLKGDPAREKQAVIDREKKKYGFDQMSFAAKNTFLKTLGIVGDDPGVFGKSINPPAQGKIKEEEDFVSQTPGWVSKSPEDLEAEGTEVFDVESNYRPHLVRDGAGTITGHINKAGQYIKGNETQARRSLAGYTQEEAQPGELTGQDIAAQQRAAEEQSRLEELKKAFNEQINIPELTKVMKGDLYKAALVEGLIPALMSGVQAGGIGAGAGAITGAGLGSIVPGLGTGVGGVLGGVIGGIGAFSITAFSDLYGTWVGEEKEEVGDMRQIARSSISNLKALPTYSTKGISATNLELMKLRSLTQLKEAREILKKKEGNVLIKEVSDYQRPMYLIDEFIEGYLPLIELDLQRVAIDPSYIPQELVLGPEYEAAFGSLDVDLTQEE